MISQVNTRNLVVNCHCGNKIDFEDLYDSTVNDLDSFSKLASFENEELICDSCNRKYSLSLDISLDISIDHVALEELEEGYKSKHGEELPPTYFNELDLDDETLLEDGEYFVGKQVYRILDGKLLYKLSALTDENQMDLFELEGTLAS
ncbi:hypothetical protein [Oceanobacillus profundus]|uniref:Uncharacterized protein n=1 Tax=Oceanobacillus profundus TaxID=372463 RepID=A0A417YGB5_9BACI|nr:hypothetical protein [Oceanobacillus profundus]RHW31868.1 hypothetical protein D1B32_11560 [Oceanobacillus profundus]